MPGPDLILSVSFLVGILILAKIDDGLRRVDGPSWREGWLAAAGVTLVFFSCAISLA